MIACAIVGFLAGQMACFSAPPYKPDTETAVTPEDANTISNGMTASTTSDTAQAAAVASTTLHTAPGAQPPDDTATLIADPNAMATIDSNDFAPLAQAFGILYNDNPAAYYVTLQQVVDSGLRGAIQYALNDTLNYHSVALRDNGGTAATESAQFATYSTAATTAADPHIYSAWAVPSMVTQTPALTMEAPGTLPGIASLIPQVGNHDAIVAALLAAEPANMHGVDGNAFAQICIAMAPMYQTSLVQYYQVLTQIPDTHLRDVVNFAITDAIANHPTILTASDGGASVFATQTWPYYNQVGFVGSGQLAPFTAIALNPAGPLQGKPYPSMQ